MVKDIQLSGRQARVVMDIDAGAKVPKDSHGHVLDGRAARGEDGRDRPRDVAGILRPGEMLPGAKSLGFDDLGPLLGSVVDKLKSAGDAVSETLGPETRANLGRTIESLADLSAELRDLVRRNRGGIGETVATAEKAAASLERSVNEVSAAARETLGLVKDVAAENRDSLKLSLERIKDLVGKLEKSLELLNSSFEKVSRGEGTLGKIIQDSELLYQGRRRPRGGPEDGRSPVVPQGDFRPRDGLFRGDRKATLRPRRRGPLRKRGFRRRRARPGSLAADVHPLSPGRIPPGEPRRQGRVHRIRVRRGDGCLRLRRPMGDEPRRVRFQPRRQPAHAPLGEIFPHPERLSDGRGGHYFTLAGKRDVFFGLGLSMR